MLPTTQDNTVQLLAEELAIYTGESVTNAVAIALRERLQRVKVERKADPPLHQVLLRIGRECADLPVLDSRSPDAIVGYNELGLPA